ncbi:S8 family serine peptidase [Methanococcoides sp. FTZ1]|uniref:S8 family serine peptidase n=1 Tax=Methanococcoides sp. FTZ1 TaxID=3439061 RepID=UPI003F855140
MNLHSYKLTILTVLLLITGMVIPVSAFAQPVNAQFDIYDELTVEMPDNGLYVPDEIIVKFSPGVSEEKIANINARNGATIKYASQYAGFKVLKIPKNRNVEQMAEIYSKNPNVEYAVPNAIMRGFAVDDPYYSLQWNLHGPNGINVEPAWEISTGTGVVVAVLDTGVAQNAPDLTNTNFVAGYDFVNDDVNPTDDNSHGTHVAGTIAQSTNNGKGVAGIAYDCSIMPVKVLNAQGSGTLDNLVNGIYFATDNGADVISMSLGYSPGYYPGALLDEALEDAHSRGVTIVAAAGNDRTGVVSYPAAYEKCIAVGATGNDAKLAYYSNYGEAIDIVAPGGNLRRDVDRDGYADGILQNTFNPETYEFGYYFFQGTSMATPHVSGVAALLIAQGASNAEVRTALESTARDLGDTGWDTTYGWGLIDAKAALDSLSTGPAPVNNPPVADAGGPYNGIVGTEIQFYGSDSNDIDGTIASYNWDFGDGSSSNEADPIHIFDAAMDYTVTLTVTDNVGATDTASTTASVTTATDPDPTEITITIDRVDVIDRTAGKNTFVSAKAVVTVAPDVAGTTVTGFWTDATSDVDTGQTDGSGTLTFYSDEVKYKKETLTFTFNVEGSTFSATYPQ